MFVSLLPHSPRDVQSATHAPTKPFQPLRNGVSAAQDVQSDSLVPLQVAHEGEHGAHTSGVVALPPAGEAAATAEATTTAANKSSGVVAARRAAREAAKAALARGEVVSASGDARIDDGICFKSRTATGHRVTSIAAGEVLAAARASRERDEKKMAEIKLLQASLRETMARMQDVQSRTQAVLQSSKAACERPHVC